MRIAYFAPIPSLLHIFFGGRKEASRKLSFEWKIIIWIGHYYSNSSGKFCPLSQWTGSIFNRPPKAQKAGTDLSIKETLKTCPKTNTEGYN